MSWSSQDKKVNEHRLSTIDVFKKNFDKNKEGFKFQKAKNMEFISKCKEKNTFRVFSLGERVILLVCHF